MLEATFDFASSKPVKESKNKYNHVAAHQPPDTATVDINTNNSKSQPSIEQSPTAPSNPVKQTTIRGCHKVRFPKPLVTEC
ncbi:hypothetical protein NPIL_37641 [Nephila pilipes]|uniref:Uncharacterized protein n=1 Tax=Nephila pilipes TaxID=299642 RepID=A0A8X6NPP6_NEPPI|nr:hypothetical protein NPIL_37641 [Nephila pilipes]